MGNQGKSKFTPTRQSSSIRILKGSSGRLPREVANPPEKIAQNISETVAPEMAFSENNSEEQFDEGLLLPQQHVQHINLESQPLLQEIFDVMHHLPPGEFINTDELYAHLLDDYPEMERAIDKQDLDRLLLLLARPAQILWENLPRESKEVLLKFGVMLKENPEEDKDFELYRALSGYNSSLLVLSSEGRVGDESGLQFDVDGNFIMDEERLYVGPATRELALDEHGYYCWRNGDQRMAEKMVQEYLQRDEAYHPYDLRSWETECQDFLPDANGEFPAKFEDNVFKMLRTLELLHASVLGKDSKDRKHFLRTDGTISGEGIGLLCHMLLFRNGNIGNPDIFDNPESVHIDLAGDPLARAVGEALLQRNRWIREQSGSSRKTKNYDDLIQSLNFWRDGKLQWFEVEKVEEYPLGHNGQRSERLRSNYIAAGIRRSPSFAGHRVDETYGFDDLVRNTAGRCLNCGAQFSAARTPQKGHIYPNQRLDLANCVPQCQICNGTLGATPMPSMHLLKDELEKRNISIDTPGRSLTESILSSRGFDRQRKQILGSHEDCDDKTLLREGKRLLKLSVLPGTRKHACLYCGRPTSYSELKPSKIVSELPLAPGNIVMKCPSCFSKTDYAAGQVLDTPSLFLQMKNLEDNKQGYPFKQFLLDSAVVRDIVVIDGDPREALLEKIETPGKKEVKSKVSTERLPIDAELLRIWDRLGKSSRKTRATGKGVPREPNRYEESPKNTKYSSGQGSPSGPTQTQVYDYHRQHPEATAEEIAAAIPLDPGLIYGTLKTLRKKGLMAVDFKEHLSPRERTVWDTLQANGDATHIKIAEILEISVGNLANIVNELNKKGYKTPKVDWRDSEANPSRH